MVNKKSSMGDMIIISMVILMSIGANLPDTIDVAFNRKYLLAGLIAIVAVSLLRYLKFTFILVVAILAVGANLPEQIATELGIDKSIMMFALVAMVVISLTNQIFKLPSGVDTTRKPAEGSRAHGAAALYSAINKGRLPAVRAILHQGVSPNVRTAKGETPLIYAASKGYGDIIQFLLSSGADISAKDNDGRSALDIASECGFTRVAEILRGAGATNSTSAAPSQAAAGSLAQQS